MVYLDYIYLVDEINIGGYNFLRLYSKSQNTSLVSLPVFRNAMTSEGSNVIGCRVTDQ